MKVFDILTVVIGIVVIVFIALPAFYGLVDKDTKTSTYECYLLGSEHTIESLNCMKDKNLCGLISRNMKEERQKCL